MTRLCVSLTGSTCRRMIEDMQAAAAAGADMVELRLDCLDEWDPSGIDMLLGAASRFPGEVLATCRRAAEGGHCDEDETVRVSRLEHVGLSDAIDYIDFEYESLRASPNIRQKIALVCGSRHGPAGRPKRKLILSKHEIEATPPWYTLRFTLDAMGREGADVVKLACRAGSIVDALHMLDALHYSVPARPTVALAMGEAGLITRVLARKLGAFLSFAALEEGREAAPGQVSIERMRGLYRWDAIGPETRVYGVIGCPVAHSMSPAIMNAAFAAAGIDAVYLPLRVEPGFEALAAFLTGVLRRPWLHMRGFSVTIPHKQDLLRFVDRRDGVVEPLARRIAAANTLVIEPGEHLDGADAKVSAYNTDYRGALEALCEGLACRPEDLRDTPVAVLGAGGVSRAIVAGLRDWGCRVTIFNRTRDKAEALAAEFGAQARPIEDCARHDARVVVNGTSLGMWPDVDASPLPPEGLAGRPLVFDTVYNPMETRLLREARERGCATVDGVAMFVRQAAAQFELWTGRPAPIDTMRATVIERLSA